MQILHIGTLDIKSGGPAMSIYYTVTGLRELNINAELFMYELDDHGQLIGNKVPVHYAGTAIDSKFLYSIDYKKKLKATGKYDIYHAHGVWQYPTYAMVDIARKFNKPYLISPRGMLYPQDIRKSNKLFKEISLRIRLLRDLNHAACVHATCIEEMEHLRNLGVKSPIAVIPNPIDISGTEKPVEPKEKLRIGYLGRVHPRKNIERLIYAWGQLQSNVYDGELIIIGDGDKQYLDFLKQESKRLQLKNVVFTGFLSGVEKDIALSSLSYLVVPSDFENFGNIVTEALVRGIPVITSKGTPWEELNTHNCGWWVDNDVNTIAKTLREAIALPEETYSQMGINGRELMKNNYSIEIVAGKMLLLYEWILEQGEKPEFVKQ